MSAIAILSELQRRGVSVIADGDALVLKPRRAVDSELLARVRERKSEIIRALSARSATCAASCYQIEPGRWIHHPWDGCAAPTLPAKATQTFLEQTCWHCGGEKECPCITCWDARKGLSGECTVCRGTGKPRGWLQ